MMVFSFAVDVEVEGSWSGFRDRAMMEVISCIWRLCWMMEVATKPVEPAMMSFMFVYVVFRIM